MHVLRRSHEALAPDGTMLDLQVIRPDPRVETVDGRLLCEADGTPLFEYADAAREAVDLFIRDLLLEEEAVDDHDVMQHYSTGTELVEDWEPKKRALPVERLLQAVAVARAGKPVLGPGLDGGYYLVGLPRRFDRVRRVRAFLGNSLGGDGALAQARAALGEAELLESWADVDTAAELEALADQLCGEPDLAPAVAAWLDGPWRDRAGLASCADRMS